MSTKRALIPLLVLAGMLVAVSSASAAAEPEPFAITSFTMQATRATRISEVAHGSETETVIDNEPYEPAFTQAGGHPWALTTTLEFTHEEFVEKNLRTVLPTQDLKDIVVDLPPGLLGNPRAVPSCPLTVALGGVACPAATQIGVYRVRWISGNEVLAPIVNVTPEHGQSAEFAFENEANATFLLTAHLVRVAQGTSGCVTAGGCYGFTIVSSGISPVQLYRIETTFWGDPADSSHNAMRGRDCEAIINSAPFNCHEDEGGESSGVETVPFLTMPADCAAGGEVAGVRVDTWEQPGQFLEASADMPGATGCNNLAFDPSVKVDPDTTLADEPVGLGVTLGVPLDENPAAEATPQLRDTTLTLPEGMSVSPGVVDGIQACNEFGPEGINITGPESETLAPDGELELAPGHCPDASTVGEAEAITPLLAEPVKGHVYLARPGCGGAGQSACTDADALDGNLYRLYLELGGSGPLLSSTGVHFKVPLETEANPATGQLTTRAVGTPQAPFSELKIRLNGGPRAPLDNPAVCGEARTTSDLTPWSAPGITPEGLSMSGTPDATPFSYFTVDGCAGTTPFAPGFSSGTVSPQAGAFSEFTLNLTRQDREQYVKGIQVHTPPGLLGVLASVPLCEEPLADNGHCPESSQIGTTRVASGAGSHPFEIEGKVYLTKGYGGAPFGLSVVTDAVAGPFNLGLVVVRARIAVDPETSQLTVTTDETGPYALPQIIFGVPLRLQRITVDIDRPGFMFNPTNCAGQQVTAVVSGSENAKSEVKSPFAAAGCKSLAFKPSFAVSTSARTSKADGASLDAKLSYPAGSLGSEANIASVKVELPKQLPSRLTTLQKACTAQTFEANPANCPSASIVGIAKTSTPLLPVELTGPVYFVSHGGEAFPSLIVVLQGDGVRVDLTGATFISKAGITSSTFKTVPDVPVNTFELYLPEGHYSALAANGNLCALTQAVSAKRKVSEKVHGRTVKKTVTTRTVQPASLTMPTEMVAQNGAVFKQSTKIAVTGCTTNTKAKPKKKQAKRKAKKANSTSLGRTRS